MFFMDAIAESAFPLLQIATARFQFPQRELKFEKLGLLIGKWTPRFSQLCTGTNLETRAMEKIQKNVERVRKGPF
jgi:hypothetical protein